MMVNSVKPKIGLLLFSAEWFRQISADRGSFAGLGTAIQNDAARIKAALGERITVIDDGIIDTREGAVRSARKFLAEGVDGVVVCNVTWGEDRLLLEALRLLDSVPLLLWCFNPFESLPEQMDMSDLLRASGPVAALQASGPLRRLGRQVMTAFGSTNSPSVLSDIVSFANAAQIARDLKRLKIGVLPYRCDQMTGTYVDEFRLRKEIGPELIYVSVGEYCSACDSVSHSRVENLVSYVANNFCISSTVSSEGLARSARATLGLADLANSLGLGAIALEDVSQELHRILGLRPCLYCPELAGQAVVSMEADVCGAISIWILRALTGRAAMYSEIFTFDENQNYIVIGHAGIHDVSLASSLRQVFIEPDGEYRESEPDSCWMSFRVKPGPVTLLSTFCDTDKFKFVISKGLSLPGERKVLGSPHGCVRLDQPVSEFFRKALSTGMTQHWGMVHAQVMQDLSALGTLLKVKTVVV